MTDYFSAILGAVTKIFIRTSKDYQLKEFENLCLTITSVSLFGGSVVFIEIKNGEKPGKMTISVKSMPVHRRSRPVAVSAMTHEVILARENQVGAGD